MVAEATANCTSPKKVKGRGHARQIDLTTRSQARNLYAVQHLTAQDVANRTGLTVPQVYSLAKRDGWVKTRVQLRAKAAQVLRDREEQQVEELIDAMAIKSQVLSLGSLDKAIDTLARDDQNAAKDLQAYSQAAKNAVGIFRQARGLDAKQVGDGGTSQINVMFVGQLTRSAERTAVNVTPVESVPVSTTPDAQSTIC